MATQLELSNNVSKPWIGTKTIVMMIIFVLIFATLGAFLGYVIQLLSSDFHWYYGSLIMFGIALIAILITFSSIHKYVDEMMKLSEKQQGSYPNLEQMIIGISSKAGIEKPGLVVVKNEEPNAYTCGFKDKYFICVHDSLLKMLNDQEIEGVLAHEVSHVKDGDTFTTLLTNSLGNVTTIFSKYLGVGLLLSGMGMVAAGTAISKGRNDGASAGISLVVMVIGFTMAVVGGILCIFYPLAMIVKMAISRDREYYADKSAAYITGKPRALANALRKISGISIPDEKLSDRFTDLMIINHFSTEKFTNRMMRTHPSTEDRIKRLEEIDKKMRASGMDTDLIDRGYTNIITEKVGSIEDSPEYAKAVAETCSDVSETIKELCVKVFSENGEQATLNLVKKADVDPQCAQIAAAVYYYGLCGVPQSYELAFKYATTAAEMGYDIAPPILACMYGLGHGTKVNVRKSIYWLGHSSIVGHLAIEVGDETIVIKE